MADSVKLSLEIATAAAEKALAGFKSQVSSTTTAFDVFQGTLAGGLAVKAVSSLTGLISGSFGEMIDQAAEFEVAVNDLNTALRSSGQFSQSTSQDLQDFAGAMQEVTVFGDEAALSAASLLLNLTNLSTDGVKQATSAAADLAATLNIDLSTAAEMVAKAVNGSFTAFQKMGIQIQKGDTDAERLTNTLAALQSMQGAAQAKTQTYAGATEQLNNAQGDLLKTVGGFVTKNPLFIAAINSAAEAFASATEWVIENEKFLKDLATTAGIMAVAVAGAAGAWGLYTLASTPAIAATIALIGSISSLSAASVVLTAAASTAWAALTGPVGLAVIGVAAVGAAVYGLVKYWDDVKASIFGSIAAVIDFSATAVKLVSGDMAAKLRLEAQGWRDKASAIREAQRAAQEAASGDSEQEKARKKKLAEEQAEIERKNVWETAQARTHAAELAGIQAILNLQMADEAQAHADQMSAISGTFWTADLERQMAYESSSLASRQAYETQMLEIQLAAKMEKARAIDDDEARSTALRDAARAAELDREKLHAKQKIEVLRQANRSQETLAQDREQNQRDTYAKIATLADSNNQTLASIGKAAAITQIAIETPVAVAKAYSAFPPPANFAAAALVAAAMAAQAAKVAGLSFAKGGVVGGFGSGSSMGPDNLTASVRKGEMYLNAPQQRRLFEIANGGAAGGEGLIDAIWALVNQPISVNIDGREIAVATRAQLRRGVALT